MKFNGLTLKTKRKEAGLTLDELALKARVDGNTIHYLETGQTSSPRTLTVQKLADALGVDWTIFFAPDFQKIGR